jgi:CheY-like chemotaxis protein
MKSRFTGNSVAACFRRGTVSVPERPKSRARESRTRAVLLISDDSSLAERLWRAARETETVIVRAGDSDAALKQLRLVRPIAVLLDLDLAGNAAWGIADRLLQDENCPQLLLLTSRIGHLDLGAASQAGSVLDKAAQPAWLLGLLSELPGQPGSTQAARNAIQRVLIRWMLPCDWPIPATPSHRWWGINE